MSAKFEKLIDYLVNEETEKASALFHEIVVEKSKAIYSNILREEAEEDDLEEATHEDEDETVESIENDEDESFEESSSFPVQDQGDDFANDVEDHDAMDASGLPSFDDNVGGDNLDHDGFGDEGFGEEGNSEPATKDDVLDLSSALAELNAKFEQLLKGEEAEEEKFPEIHDHELDGIEDADSTEDSFGSDDEGGSDGEEDFGFDEPKEEPKDKPKTESQFRKSAGETMREYIEKVSQNMDGGLVGGRTGETMSNPKDGKSPISSGSGKPTSNTNAKNIAQKGPTEDQDGTKPYGKVGGVLKKGGDVPDAGNFENSQSKSRSTRNIWSDAKKPAKGEGNPVGAGTGKNSVTGATNTKSIEAGNNVRK